MTAFPFVIGFIIHLYTFQTVWFSLGDSFENMHVTSENERVCESAMMMMAEWLLENWKWKL